MIWWVMVACGLLTFAARFVMFSDIAPKKLPGWSEDVRGLSSIEQFPDNARRYIERIEALAEIPAALLSVGPGREETIIVRELFG